MYFPALLEEQLKFGPDWEVNIPPKRLELTLLLVEDNESLRGLICDYLEVEGCKVLSAADGTAAVREADEFPGQIDVLLTDVVLPGNNGKWVAEEVARRRPGIKVVYTSGYTPNAIVHHGVLEPDVLFLQKPFTRAELLAQLRSAMGGSEG
jgi:DNA-binding response OmpR family regulator